MFISHRFLAFSIRCSRFHSFTLALYPSVLALIFHIRRSSSIVHWHHNKMKAQENKNYLISSEPFSVTMNNTLFFSRSFHWNQISKKKTNEHEKNKRKILFRCMLLPTKTTTTKVFKWIINKWKWQTFLFSTQRCFALEYFS